MKDPIREVDCILNHPDYKEALEAINQLERERIFCRHNMQHFLDVARIAHILNLEEAAGVPRNVIYAAALLHDVGRHRQYLEQIPHEEAGAVIAEKILEDCACFDESVKEEILLAIRSHRKIDCIQGLPGLIFRADKLSRSCFCCPAETECDWSREEKNMSVLY